MSSEIRRMSKAMSKSCETAGFKNNRKERASVTPSTFRCRMCMVTQPCGSVSINLPEMRYTYFRTRSKSRKKKGNEENRKNTKTLRLRILALDFRRTQSKTQAITVDLCLSASGSPHHGSDFQTNESRASRLFLFLFCLLLFHSYCLERQ